MNGVSLDKVEVLAIDPHSGATGLHDVTLQVNIKVWAMNEFAAVGWLMSALDIDEEA